MMRTLWNSRLQPRRTLGRGFCWGLVLVLLASLGCTLTWGQGNVPPTTSPVVPVVTQAPPVDAGDWTSLVPGIERRELTLPVGALRPHAVVYRFDPGLVTFRVHYSPGAPRMLSAWRTDLPLAAVIVNGGFFNEADFALGLLVADGEVNGQSFTSFGGMFQVGSDGSVRVRSLVSEPYQGAALTQALQSFPMLVEVGGVLAPQGDGFDQRARRTLIAQDRAGRIVLAVVPFGLVSFAELQDWLLDSDLDIQVAVALDGGRSTGLSADVAGYAETYDTYSPVPAVLAIYVR